VKNLPAGRQVSASGATEGEILRFAQNDKKVASTFRRRGKGLAFTLADRWRQR
jgi:hypothetical protein